MNTFRVFEYYIPTTFFSIRRHMTLGNILEYLLMEITNIIVIRFITLTEYFIFHNFFP